jgi:hypothetical protein
VVEPQGTWYAFDARASKLRGGEGFADVWKCGYFGWVYKGKHASLDKAYEQLQLYRESLQQRKLSLRGSPPAPALVDGSVRSAWPARPAATPALRGRIASPLPTPWHRRPRIRARVGPGHQLDRPPAAASRERIPGGTRRPHLDAAADRPEDGRDPGVR